MDLEYDVTSRGFPRWAFMDLYGEICTIQKSSLAREHAIWVGVHDTTPKIMGKAVREDLTGWVNYPLPEGALIASRMHLSQEQVKALLPILQHFAESGELPEADEE